MTAQNTIDPLRVRLATIFGGYRVLLDDEDVGWLSLPPPYGAQQWTGRLLGEPVSLTGPTGRKALHKAVCSALHGLQA